uniref:Integrin alpha-2 domain-containing protein n=1 Tax=Oncorhynchus mykiss TaxID=8022 RepID=A0A8K9UX35_ONCMY
MLLSCVASMPMERLRKLCISLSLILPCLQWTTCFNLDIDKPYVFSGPEGSYFGFSVDFFQPDAKSNILIGAPKANTSSASTVVERGAVYTCPWQKSSDCTQVQFDNTGEYRREDPFSLSSLFDCCVALLSLTVLMRCCVSLSQACAPLYQWSTYSVSEREPVGTCFLKKGQEVVEYSPCRSSKVVVGGPGSFYWQGQLISDDISEIITRFNRQYYTPYSNQLTTKSASAQYDDSYLGKSCCPKRPPIPSIVTVLMAAYFGHSVAATDINNDGLVDLFVGAPLFMDRGSDGKLREVGQVSVFLGKGGFSFNTPITLSGTEIYSRFGSSIATLGDLDMDGFNDIAIAAPYGGPKHRGLVYIHNGRAAGPDPVPSQVLEGRWASSYMPPSFGYSLHGATDIDQNGYPDLIVGVFGADKAVLYRARPVISVNATLDISPQILNPEERSCKLPDSDTKVSCFKVKYCLKASGRGAPDSLKFQVHLVLDRLKHKGATKRVLFLHSKTSQYTKNMTVSNGQGPACEEQEAFLIDDSEFRDKITPISVFMEFSLDYQQAADKTGLLPILEQTTPTNISKQAHVLLDCGDDNICKPDLKLSVVSDQKQIYIGDDNPLTLEVTAENRGEGAYEAELHVFLPPQADFTGVVRNSETLSRLSCAYKTENQTRVVVCDLGNPMKGGIKVLAGLRFSVHQLSEQDTLVKFDLQIQSSNQFNSTSSLVSSITTLAVLANVDFRGVALPDQVFLPIANWKSKENPVVGEDIGPRIQHIYELRNRGPSTFSKAILDIEWPYRFNNGSLLYITELEVDRGMNCSTDMEINPLNVSNPLSTETNGSASTSGDNTEGRNRNHVHRRELAKKEMEGELETLDCSKAQCLKIRCQVGRVERGQSTTLYVHSRLGVATFLKVRLLSVISFVSVYWMNRDVFMSVIWLKSDPEPVPGWVVALAVLAGLLLLALLIFIMYKLGFFKRVRPPQEDNTEKEQLAPQENGDRNNEA